MHGTGFGKWHDRGVQKGWHIAFVKMHAGLLSCMPVQVHLLCSKKHGIDLALPEAKRRRIMTLYSGHFALEQACLDAPPLYCTVLRNS